MPNTRKLIVQHWLDAGRPAVGQKFLEALQQQFGEPNGMSPASMARLLADEGAELRHPEIIEFDAQWRAAQFTDRAGRFAEVAQFLAGASLNLEQSEIFITKLENLRKQFEDEGEVSTLSELRSVAVEARQRAQIIARNHALDGAVRLEQSEVAEWLKVWLQTPGLFADWLDLRKRSDDFQQNLLTRIPKNSPKK